MSGFLGRETSDFYEILTKPFYRIKLCFSVKWLDILIKVAYFNSVQVICQWYNYNSTHLEMAHCNEPI